MLADLTKSEAILTEFKGSPRYKGVILKRFLAIFHRGGGGMGGCGRSSSFKCLLYVSA